MAKADTGVAGPVVAELAYRNEYIAVRGQAKLAEEAWQRNKCRESPPAATAAPDARAARKRQSATRSHAAVRQRGLLTRLRANRPRLIASRPPVVNPVLPRQHALGAHRLDREVAREGRGAGEVIDSSRLPCGALDPRHARAAQPRIALAARRQWPAPPSFCGIRRGIWPAPRHPRSPCPRLARQTAAWRARRLPAARSRHRSIRRHRAP